MEAGPIPLRIQDDSDLEAARFALLAWEDPDRTDGVVSPFWETCCAQHVSQSTAAYSIADAHPVFGAGCNRRTGGGVPACAVRTIIPACAGTTSLTPGPHSGDKPACEKNRRGNPFPLRQVADDEGERLQREAVSP